MGNAYSASDYAGLKAGVYEFYFGYEHTKCPTHGNDAGEACGECGMDVWAFVAWRDGKQLGRLSAKELSYHGEDCMEILLRGIARFGDKFWKD